MSKLTELQDAMNQYGEASARNYELVRHLGQRVIVGFRDYLNYDDCVMGVPPVGDFDTNVDDYREAIFSTYHNLKLTAGPIQMGLAIQIPHTKDDGSFWMRVVLEFSIESARCAVAIGDGPTLMVALDGTDEGLQPLFEAIHDYIKVVLVNPVRALEAEQTGKIGFL